MKKIIVNYIAQVLTLIANIITIPIYLKIYGAIGFGYISIMILFQSLFAIIDFGFTPVIIREAASNKNNKSKLASFLKTIVTIIFLILIIVVSSILINSEKIGSYFKLNEELSIEAGLIFNFIVAISAIRWFSSFARNALIGLGYVVEVSYYLIVTTTIRYFGVVLYAILISSNVLDFFIYGLIVSFAECLFIYFYLESKTKFISNYKNYSFLTIADFKRILNFSTFLIISSVCWGLSSQLDRIFVSNRYGLEILGYFTIITSIAGVLLYLSMPLINFVLPKLIDLFKSKSEREFNIACIDLTSVFAIIYGFIASIFFWHSSTILKFFTDSELFIDEYSYYMFIYVCGTAFLAISTITYYAQIAIGNMKFHVIGNVLYLVLLATLLYVSVNYFSIVAICYTWLGLNFTYCVFWGVFVLHKLDLKYYRKFISRILSITFLVFAVSFLVDYLLLNVLIDVKYSILSMTSSILLNFFILFFLLRKEIFKLIGRYRNV